MELMCPIYQGALEWVIQKEETRENIAEAIRFHLEGMKAEGLVIPLPTTEAENLMLAFA